MSDPNTAIDIAPSAEVVKQPLGSDQSRLQALQNEIFEDSVSKLRTLMRFDEWPAGDRDKQEAVKLRWIMAGMEPAEADRHANLLNAAWMSKKDAPVALDILRSIYVSEVKARSLENSAPKTMNVQVVALSAPIPNFKRVRVDKE